MITHDPRRSLPHGNPRSHHAGKRQGGLLRPGRIIAGQMTHPSSPAFWLVIRACMVVVAAALYRVVPSCLCYQGVDLLLPADLRCSGVVANRLA